MGTFGQSGHTEPNMNKIDFMHVRRNALIDSIDCLQTMAFICLLAVSTRKDI
jgi:hypothetical protein